MALTYNGVGARRCSVVGMLPITGPIIEILLSFGNKISIAHYRNYISVAFLKKNRYRFEIDNDNISVALCLF
jgi:hypothetical protein